MLSAFSILMIIMLVLIVVSWILYWAKVQTTVDIPVAWDPNTGEVTGTEAISQRIRPMGIVDLFIAPMKGFIEKAGIIIFIMVLGAFIWLVISSKALEGATQSIIAKMKGHRIWAILPLMIFFSVAGTTMGMAEESLGFYLITVPLMIAAGFDTFTGFLVVFVGAGVGVLASTVNPFVVTVAIDGLGQDASGKLLSAGDGLVWRFVCWFLMTAIAVTFVMLYAWRVQKNSEKSVTFQTREADREYFLKNAQKRVKMNWRRITTLVIFAITFIVMIVYLINWDQIFNTNIMQKAADWISRYIPYIASRVPGWGLGGLEVVAGFFLISSVVVGMVNFIGVKHEDGKNGEQVFISEFMHGASDILSVCLIIATAAGIGYLLRESYMQDLFVRGLASSIGKVKSGIGKVIIFYLLFIPLSFLIPSTSGFAAAVFPLLTQVLQTSAGTWDPVTASGTIAAFAFAAGIVNLVTPTSGVVMGALQISRISYGTLWKGLWPVLLVFFAASIALLAIGGFIGGTIA